MQKAMLVHYYYGISLKPLFHPIYTEKYLMITIQKIPIKNVKFKILEIGVYGNFNVFYVENQKLIILYILFSFKCTITYSYYY